MLYLRHIKYMMHHGSKKKIQKKKDIYYLYIIALVVALALRIYAIIYISMYKYRYIEVIPILQFVYILSSNKTIIIVYT